jgi:multimeric flavodoxin WrbA
MKITAFVGSPRKKHTYLAVEEFGGKLQALGEIDYEIVHLSDYRIDTCKGCIACFDKGEERCPLKDDDWNLLLEKVNNSDGVVFASPNYAFHVSAIMKTFLDRFGFCFHRPRFFGKTFTCIVAQGIYGGNTIVKYFNFIGNALGFNVVKGVCIRTLEPMTEKAQRNIDNILDRQSRRFYARLRKNAYPTPSIFALAIFRMSRSSMRAQLDESYRDYVYYREQGWFESDFYYPVALNPVTKMAGILVDMLATRMARYARC